MTDPIGTAQERELIDFLRNDGRARNRHQGPNAPLHKSEQAADALESRSTEVGRLTETVEREISAWAFAHDIDGAARNELFARIRAALSLQRRV